METDSYLLIICVKYITFILQSQSWGLRPVQQSGSYWDRSSVLPLVELKPTEVMIRCQTCKPLGHRGLLDLLYKIMHSHKSEI